MAHTHAMTGWQQVPLSPIEEPLARLDPDEHLLAEPMYSSQGYTEAFDAIYLRQGVLERLHQAARRLPDGLTVLVWDGWRPLDLQRALYLGFSAKLSRDTDLTGDELARAVSRYVSEPSADPRCPSPHLTGGAVDLTLASRDGIPLDLGTEFDDFNIRAKTDYYERQGLDAHETEIRDRRRLLCAVMSEVGFSNYPEEWWHFDLGNQFWGLRNGRSAYYGAVALPRTA